MALLSSYDFLNMSYLAYINFLELLSFFDDMLLNYDLYYFHKVCFDLSQINYNSDCWCNENLSFNSFFFLSKYLLY